MSMSVKPSFTALVVNSHIHTVNSQLKRRCERNFSFNLPHAITQLPVIVRRCHLYHTKGNHETQTMVTVSSKSGFPLDSCILPDSATYVPVPAARVRPVADRPIGR